MTAFQSPQKNTYFLHLNMLQKRIKSNRTESTFFIDSFTSPI